MERLTERYKDPIVNTVLIKECGDKLCKNICDDIEYDCSKCELEKVLEKLAIYEDLEEQGLLVRLPCKVGDDLYCIVNGEVKKLKVHSFEIPDFEITDIEFKYVDGFKIVRFVGEVGKTVFLTREEAEKKLEEMKK